MQVSNNVVNSQDLQGNAAATAKAIHAVSMAESWSSSQQQQQQQQQYSQHQQQSDSSTEDGVIDLNISLEDDDPPVSAKPAATAHSSHHTHLHSRSHHQHHSQQHGVTSLSSSAVDPALAAAGISDDRLDASDKQINDVIVSHGGHPISLKRIQADVSSEVQAFGHGEYPRESFRYYRLMSVLHVLRLLFHEGLCSPLHRVYYRELANIHAQQLKAAQ